MYLNRDHVLSMNYFNKMVTNLTQEDKTQEEIKKRD